MPYHTMNHDNRPRHETQHQCHCCGKDCAKDHSDDGKPALSAIVSVENVDFSFGKNKALNDITFTIEKGDFLGIIGSNGSGKTTLLKLMLGLYKPENGRILLFGKDISSFSDWNRIGYVAQKASHIPDSFIATVYEVVAMGLLSKKGFPRMITKKDDEAIISALKEVNMARFSGKRITELSGGQQQRVFIARAIVSDPEILFLDEPTTGVDFESTTRFYETLERLNRKRGMTIVLISHDIGTITKYVTKVACLGGRLVFHGTHKEFCNSEHAMKFLTQGNHLLCHNH